MPLAAEIVVEGRPVLFVGAGGEIPAKVRRLVDAGARVTVVAPAPDPEIVALAAAGRVALAERAFEEVDRRGAFVVFVATSEEALGARLFPAMRDEGRLLCVVDRPELSTFANVALVEAAGLRVTVGTRGASPALARRLREDLEALLSNPKLARFVDVLRAAREAVPRGERAARMAALVEGFALEATLRFPAWLEGGDDPPDTPT